MPDYNFYTTKDNGDLKFLERVEDAVDVDMATDALLDALPKLARYNPFTVVDDSNLMEVEAGEEIVQPRRSIKVSGRTLVRNVPKKRGPKPAQPEFDDLMPTVQEVPKRRGRPPGTKNKVVADESGTKRRGRPRKVVPEDVDQATVAAAPKRRGRPPGSKNKTATAKPATEKVVAKKAPAKKVVSKKISALTPNAASAE